MRFIIIFSLIIKVRLYFLKEETTMNLLKDYNNDSLYADEFIAKRDEIDAIGYFQNYLNDEYTCMRLKNHYYHGNNYIKEFISILKNNNGLVKLIKNITIDDTITDDNESTISIKLPDTTISIDLKNKKVTGYTEKEMQYSDDYILTPIEDKNKLATVIEKVDPLTLIDMKDPMTNSIISAFWSNKDVELFKSKIVKIINTVPSNYKEEFKNSKFFINKDTKATIDDFTLIGKTNKKLHCIFNRNKNVFDCDIA